jgi:hypothetical protein
MNKKPIFLSLGGRVPTGKEDTAMMACGQQYVCILTTDSPVGGTQLNNYK